MSKKIDKLKSILEEKINLKKEIATQIRQNRQIQRRLSSLIRTAEKKKYKFRLELVVVEHWIRKLGDNLKQLRKENNKKIVVGRGLIDIARCSLLLETIQRNPHDY